MLRDHVLFGCAIVLVENYSDGWVRLSLLTKTSLSTPHMVRITATAYCSPVHRWDGSYVGPPSMNSLTCTLCSGSIKGWAMHCHWSIKRPRSRSHFENMFRQRTFSGQVLYWIEHEGDAQVPWQLGQHMHHALIRLIRLPVLCFK